MDCFFLGNFDCSLIADFHFGTSTAIFNLRSIGQQAFVFRFIPQKQYCRSNDDDESQSADYEIGISPAIGSDEHRRKRLQHCAKKSNKRHLNTQHQACIFGKPAVN